MRRQTATSGINPAGSSRALRLDPLSLPVSFDAHDTRADGGVRQIELHRERVVLRRAVHGMRMAVNVRVSDFLGVALRGIDDAQMLVLVHRDPSLTHSAWRQFRRARRSPRPGRCGAISSRFRNCRKTSRASPPHGAAVTTRSAPGGRNSWCAAAAATCSIRRTSIRASARSSRGTEQRCTRSSPASPRRPATPQTATAPHRGWT